MFRALLLIIVVAIAGFAAYVATLPPKFEVSRSIEIAAPADAVYSHIEDFKKWQAWSPWANRDPNSKSTYEGAEKGKGAVFKWDGNDEVGEGQMAIVDAKPAERVDIKLDFVRPFAGTSNVDLVLEPSGSESSSTTKTTWRISGEQGFTERAIMLVMGLDMETMIGSDYETGLASLKQVVETEVAEKAAAEAKAAKEAAAQAEAEAQAQAEAEAAARAAAEADAAANQADTETTQPEAAPAQPAEAAPAQ